VTVSAVVLVCRGCGTAVDPLGPSPWACPRRAEGDVDHVLVVPVPEPEPVDPAAANPFVRYRSRLVSYRAARGAQMTDGEFVSLVHDLDDAVAAVAGVGFVVTPCLAWPGLADVVGVRELWAKDETGNVAGSHKARHLMGLAIWFEVRGRLGVVDEGRLAIASCGNAALAAATLARAIRRPIDVFVPAWADPTIVERLDELGAAVVTCQRDDRPGDPCVTAFRAAVAGGAIPFGCTGPDNGLTIDGGRTIGWELAEQVPGLSRVDVQVGGGALGTALGDGLRRMGVDRTSPRLFAVQAEGCAPFDRAYGVVRDVGLTEAVTHRSTAMWPWGGEPHGAATGILDDETYDWAGLADVVASSGGGSIVAAEADIDRARALTEEWTGVQADATGSAGLAGVLTEPADPQERLGIILSGVRR
jgi:threonine synthase